MNKTEKSYNKEYILNLFDKIEIDIDALISKNNEFRDVMSGLLQASEIVKRVKLSFELENRFNI